MKKEKVDTLRNEITNIKLNYLEQINKEKSSELLSIRR
jgi:hypothetical protein